jgi:transcriptional regulator with XRE-family HTH domain
MEEQGLSQSELARRVGVTQQTIFKLLTSNKKGSVYLHKIARELQTTAAYLMDETADPSSDLPDEAPLSSIARDLMAAFEALSPVDQLSVLHHAQALAPQQRRGPAPVPKHYRPDRPTLHDRKNELRAEKADQT